MQNFERFRSWTQSAIISGALAADGITVWTLRQHVVSLTPEQRVWWAVVLFPIFLLTAKLLMYLGIKGADLALTVSPRLRRLLAGNDHFEGNWVDVVIDGNTGQPIGCSHCVFDYKDGYFRISGTNWDPSGVKLLDFTSYQSIYADRALHYQYETKVPGNRGRGYGSNDFLPASVKPDRYEGAFLDFQFRGPMYSFGKKLSELTSLQPSDSERRQAALKFLSEYLSDPSWRQHVPVAQTNLSARPMITHAMPDAGTAKD